MTRSVVFGTGQIGRLVATRLVDAGHDVTVVSRSGRGVAPGASLHAGDATDPEFTTRVSRGADTVYFCLNATNYARWGEEFPPLQRGVLAGAEAAGARLVALENMYAYGPTAGVDLVETLPPRPSSNKAAARATMTTELLDAHRAGRIEVAIGRASDFFGPGVTASALGEAVFGAAVGGRVAQLMGDPDLPHSYSYAPDVAAGLVMLGTQPEAAGSVWHLPVAPATTTRQLVADVYRLAGHRPRLMAAGAPTLRLVGIVKPGLREYLHTLYQFTDRWVVDDSRFRSAFAVEATPLDQALADTVRWYTERARITDGVATG